MSQNIALKPRKLLPAKVRLFCAVSKSVHKNRYFFFKAGNNGGPAGMEEQPEFAQADAKTR